MSEKVKSARSSSVYISWLKVILTSPISFMYSIAD